VDEHGEVKDDEEEPIYESTEMIVEVFKVEDTDTHCVKFTKV